MAELPTALAPVITARPEPAPVVLAVAETSPLLVWRLVAAREPAHSEQA